MAIPISSTTITVKRPSVGADIDPEMSGDDAADSNVVTGVRAHISAPSGNESNVGGSQEVIEYPFNCDPCDITNTDRVYDETTGITYEVLWCETRRALGLDHVAGGLRKVAGVSNESGFAAVV